MNPLMKSCSCDNMGNKKEGKEIKKVIAQLFRGLKCLHQGFRKNSPLEAF